MADRQFVQLAGTVKRGVVHLYGKALTTTNGTLSTVAGAVTSAKQAGFTIAKTGSKVGRYTITLQDRYVGLLYIHATVSGAADAAYTTARGLNAFFRNNAVAAAAKTIDIQFARTDTGADAEVEDGATIHVMIVLDNSTV